MLERIKERTEDATGLTLDTAEELQVANYGIGGHYEPHFDFARVHSFQYSSLNERNQLSNFNQQFACLYILFQNFRNGLVIIIPRSGL